MDRIASRFAKLPDSRFAGARGQNAGRLADMDLAAEAGDVSRTQLQARALPDQPPPFVIVDVGEQHLTRYRDESGIAVETVAVGKGKLGAFDLEVDEIGSRRVEPVKIETFQQSELLQ